MTTKEKWICAPDKDTDIWYAPDKFDTKADAIEAGRAALQAFKKDPECCDTDDVFGTDFYDYKELPTTFAVGRTNEPAVYLDVDHVIETLQDQVCSQCGEVGESFLDFVPKYAKDQLEQRLNDVVHNWLTQNNLQPTCSYIDSIEEVSVAYD